MTARVLRNVLILIATLSFTQAAFAADVFTKLDPLLKQSNDPLTPTVYLPARPIFDLEKRRIGIKISHAAMARIVASQEKYLKRTKYNENLLHNFSYTPKSDGIRIDFSYQEKTFSDNLTGGVFKTGESNWDIASELSQLHFDGQGNLAYTPFHFVKDAHSSNINILTRELFIGEVMGFLTEPFGPRMTLSQTFLNFGAIIFNFTSVFNESNLDVSPIAQQLKEKNINLNYVAIDEFGLSMGGTFSDALIDKELNAMTDLLVDLILNSVKDSSVPVRQDLINILKDRIRDTLTKEIPGYSVPSQEMDQSLNLIATGKSNYNQEVKRLMKLSMRTLPLSISVRMKGKTSAAINETVAGKIIGGKAPYRYELIQGPATFNFFSFDPKTGIFLFQPNDLFTTQSFTYRVFDSLNQRADGIVAVSFDYSDGTPGRPPVDDPQPLSRAAINPTFTVTAEQTGDSRRQESDSTEPAELLKVTGGNLKVEAEAFLENLSENYNGVLNCSINWNGSDGKPHSIKDNDDAPMNFFVQQSIPANSLPANQVTILRMNCSAPEIPAVVKEIPVSFSKGNSGSSFCRYKHKKDTSGGKGGQVTSLDASGKSNSCDKDGDWKTNCKDGNSDTDEVSCEDGQLLPPPPLVTNAMCQYKHKKDTSGGKSGQTSSLDASGKARNCDKNGDWKTACKDGNSDTDEVSCEVPVSTSPPSMCQYKHKKDTAGGKSGKTTELDASGKSRSCDKNGDWKSICKDGNSDTDEVECN